jgi:hypothetical protein
MTFTTRLCVFVALAIAGIVAWQWSAADDASRDLTHLAVQQFDNDASVPANLQQASLAQNWWPLVWPALLVVVGFVLFWDDAERWWKQEESKEDHV